MCGRFAIGLPAKSIAEHFQLDSFPDFKPRYNIAPTQLAPTITHDPVSGATQAIERQWGLIPSWAKDKKIGAKMINARGETLREKPSFREAFTARRCLVPASGFYEWLRSGTKRTPFYIRHREREMLAFAGLWESWNNPQDVEIQSFTIITTAANEVLSPIHDRMPVIIPPEQYDSWLDPGSTHEHLESQLKPYPAQELERYEVSPEVNKAANDNPSLIARTTFL